MSYHVIRDRLRTAPLAALLSVALAFTASAEDKVTYANDVLPILRNSCLNCHNPDKHKAGLDLTTYQAAMDGSDNGKVIDPGNPGGSLLFKLVNHTENPAMPPKSDKLPDSQIEIIRKWIAGHALETPDSKAAIAKQNGPALEMFAQDKPDGPPPMPHDLLLEPAATTARPGAVVSIAASPRAPVIAVAAQKQVLLYNTQTLELAGVLPFPEGFPQVVKFSRDGRLVIAGGGIGAKSGRVVVWDVDTGKRVMTAGDEYDEVLAADISPDHHYIALGGPGKMVKIFKDGKLRFSIKKHTDWITALAFTSDGKLLVSGDRQGGLQVWETATGGEVFSLPSHKAGVTALAAPGPEACFSSSEDGSVKLWDLREGKEAKNWTPHKDGTLSVAFAPDGRIVTCGRDKVARLWSRDGNRLREFEAFGDVALSAAISQDRIVAGDWSGTIRVWDADGKRLAEWTPNPPTIEDQLAAVQARLEKLQADRAKTAAQLADAQKAAEKSGAESQVAAQAAAEKEKIAKDAQARLDDLAKSAADADTALQKIKTDYAQLQTAAGGLASDLAKAKAAADAAMESIAGQNVSPTGEADLQRAKDAMVKVSDAVAANRDALQNARKKMQDQAAAGEQMRSQIASAKEMAAAAKHAFDAASKNLTPVQSQAKNADETLMKIKHETGEIDHDLALAKSAEAKWKAAQVNIAVHAARDEQAARQAELDKAVDAAKQASAELDKARADLGTLQTALAAAPERIKELEKVVVTASNAIPAANAAAASAQAALQKLQTPMAFTIENMLTLATAPLLALDAPSVSPDILAAKKSLDAANHDLAQARKEATVRTAAAKKVADDLASAEKAVAQAKADAESAPDRIKKLQAAVDEITTRTAPARTAAEKAVMAAAQPVEAAKAKADAIARTYKALLREAATAGTLGTELTKK